VSTLSQLQTKMRLPRHLIRPPSLYARGTSTSYLSRRNYLHSSGIPPIDVGLANVGWSSSARNCAQVVVTNRIENHYSCDGFNNQHSQLRRYSDASWLKCARDFSSTGRVDGEIRALNEVRCQRRSFISIQLHHH
jgi:hypothetical protein